MSVDRGKSNKAKPPIDIDRICSRAVKSEDSGNSENVWTD